MNTPAFELLLQPRLMQGSWEMPVGEVTRILNSFTLGYKCSLWVLHSAVLVWALGQSVMPSLYLALGGTVMG